MRIFRTIVALPNKRSKDLSLAREGVWERTGKVCKSRQARISNLSGFGKSQNANTVPVHDQHRKFDV